MTVNVATIPAGVPFLKTLVDALLDGALVPGFRPRVDGRLDPLMLADATIYVPSQRARRALAAAIIAAGGREAALLPDIRALGDADEDELAMQDAVAGDPVRLEPVIDPLERHLLLTDLVRGWWHTLRGSAALAHGEDVAVPASLADAAWFARDLAGLMDAVATEEADWSKLSSGIDETDDIARWWQLTLTFLRIATEAWPAILHERRRLDPAQRNALMLARLAAMYEASPPAGPVIAAGAVGSNPATRRLMAAIGRLERGLVVLPGLDTDLDEEIWEALGTDETATHPQDAMHRLLRAFEARRADVRVLAPERRDAAMVLRERIVSEALRPADFTAAWGQLDAVADAAARAEAFRGVALVEAANEREEATAVALAMRETLAEPDATVALVTPDRLLARRVAVELGRFAIAVDDSAGRPLAATPHGTFARLLLAVALGREADVVSLVSLMKHPLLALGLEREALRRAVACFEIGAVRGRRDAPAVGALAAHVARVRGEEPDRHAHSARRRMAADDWNAAAGLAERLDAALAPLVALAGETPFDALVAATIRGVEACLRPADDAPLYAGEDGEAMASHLAALRDTNDGIAMPPADWPGVFEALMADRTVRARGERHPRAFIWGPLEARLQTTTRTVLGGLNEETWPAAVRNDAFLSRPMKRSLPLEPPERRIGLAAHDIQMLFGEPDLVLTRAKRGGGKPTVASRWWQRIAAVAGREALAAMRERGETWLVTAATLDEPAGPVEPAARPAPCPPRAARPRRVSFTEVERYIRDPYSVYAAKVLNMRPADPLVADTDARDRGNLYHAILERWSRERHDPTAADALDRLLAIAAEAFASADLPEATHALWWPRFGEIAADFIAWERERAPHVRATHVERYAKLVHETGLELTGFADRIDVMDDGSLAIIDYKTGTSPPAGAAEALHAPQLALEAAAAAQGAFAGVDAGYASALAYVRLRPGGGFKADHVGRNPSGKGKVNDDKTHPTDLGNRAWQQFDALARLFDSETTPYASRTRPMRAGDHASDYDHLARVQEWTGDADDEEAA